MILVDTNIPLRLAQPDHPHRQPALDALKVLATRDGERFALAPQSLYEMYVVCSRPAERNGMGMTPAEAYAEVSGARSLFQLLPESADVYHRWEGLVGKYAVSGKRAHDTRLVAMMIEHRVPRLLTFNRDDFSRYVEITTLDRSTLRERRGFSSRSRFAV